MRLCMFLALTLAACNACAPQPAPSPWVAPALDAQPPPVNAGVLACQHLRELGCPLGSDPNCAEAFSLPSKFRADPTCVMGAVTLANLAACNVTCQP
jgi:hypothetical protein